MHKTTTNAMKSRTVSAICLRPKGNMKGLFYYYSLWSGGRLHRRRRTPLPMSQEIIDRVHYIALRQKLPAGLIYTGQDGTPINQDEDDGSIQKYLESNNEPDQDIESEGVAIDEDTEGAGVNGVDADAIDIDNNVFQDTVEIMPPPANN